MIEETTPAAPVTRGSSLFDWERTQTQGSILAAALQLLRWRATIATTTVVVTLFALVYVLTRDPTFTSEAVFFPEGARPPNAAASAIATQLGIGIQTGDALNSAMTYPDIILTPYFLMRVAEAKYARSSRDSATLVDLYGQSWSTPGLRQKAAVHGLLDRLAVSPSLRTGIVTISMRAEDAQIAFAVVQRILAEVESFNLQRRQTRARAERLFVEQRLAEVRDSLRQSEDKLQIFLQQNRDYSRSPELALAYGRLDRQAGLLRALVTTLTQAFEQAKIEEVRDTPVITIISPPLLPPQRDPRGLVRMGLIGMLAGLMLGVFVAYVLDYAGRIRGDASNDATELRSALSSIGRELKRGRIIKAIISRV